MCLFLTFLTLVSGTGLPFVDDFRLAMGMIWLMLFFGGLALPIFTGIMLA
jgi:hypothetical protein